MFFKINRVCFEGALNLIFQRFFGQIRHIKGELSDLSSVRFSVAQPTLIERLRMITHHSIPMG